MNSNVFRCDCWLNLELKWVMFLLSQLFMQRLVFKVKSLNNWNFCFGTVSKENFVWKLSLWWTKSSSISTFRSSCISFWSLTSKQWGERVLSDWEVFRLLEWWRRLRKPNRSESWVISSQFSYEILFQFRRAAVRNLRSHF